MNKNAIIAALFLSVLCLFCIVNMGENDGAVDPPADSILAGDSEHGFGYFVIDGGEATLVGIKEILGNKNDAMFVVPSFLMQNGDEYSAGYDVDIPGNSIVVTTISGKSSTGSSASLLFFNTVFIGTTTIVDQGSTCMKLVIPATVSEITGSNTIRMLRSSVLIFEERTEGQPLTIGSGVFASGYTGYNDGMKFPDNTTFMVDSFRKPGQYYPYLECDVYIGKNSKFVSDGEPAPINFITRGAIYTETRMDELLNGNTVDDGSSIISSYNGVNTNDIEADYPLKMCFYQSVSAGIPDILTDCLQGYYLKDLNYYVVDYFKHLEDDLDIYVIYDAKVKEGISSANIQSAGDQIILSVEKNGGFTGNLQIQFGNTVIREDNGSFDISSITNTTIVEVKLVDWDVICMLDSDNIFEVVQVEDGGKFILVSVPFVDGKEFVGWLLDGNDYDMESAVTSDLVLTPKWADGTVYRLTVSSLSSLISVSPLGTDDLNQYGMIKPDGSICLSVSGSEKVEIRGWAVTIGDAQAVVMSGPGTQGSITLSDDCRSLTISSINANVVVDLDAIYISESHAATPVISVDTPAKAVDLVQKWFVGTGQTSNSQNVWAGGSSEPLILGDYAYVRLGASLFKVDTNTGNVVATADSELTYAFFHNLGYLGNGYIVDYVTEQVFDMDLQPAGFKVPGKVVFDDVDKVAYAFTPSNPDSGIDAAVSKYDPYSAAVVDGYLTPEWTKSIQHELYINQGGPSLPLILDGSVYWLSGERDSNGKTLIWISSTTSESGSDVIAVQITGLNGLLLDNGWITTDGQDIYVTSYGLGLLSAVSLGPSKVAVISQDLNTQKSLYLKGDAVTSAIVFVDDLAFVKVGADIFAYSKDVIAGAANGTTPNALATIRSSLSHGSITVNKCGSADEYYIYYAAYEGGKIHIVKYDSAENVFADSIVDDLHTYCSQGIRATQSGNLVYYDDTGRLYGYVAVKSNTYSFIIDDGIQMVLVESTGTDAATALSSSGYGSVSNGMLLGAKTSKISDWIEDGEPLLYVLDNGLWKEVPDLDLFFQDCGNVWLITYSNGSLPDNTTILTVADSDETAILDYLTGHRVNVDFGDVATTASYAAYKGMVVRIYTNTTEEQTIYRDPADLEVRSHGSALISENKSYSFVMPDQDVTLSTSELVMACTVTLNLGGGGSESVTSDAGWTYDESAGTWSREFESGAEFPEIAVPTKGDEGGYAFVFQSWDPALPATVTESATYSAVFEQRFVAGNLIYAVSDPAADTAKVVGYEVEPVGALEIPASVEYGGIDYAVSVVAEGALADCVGITSLVLNADTELHAFYKCYGLESITICEGVKSIGISTFAYSDGLKHVEFPSSLEEIGVNAFYKYSFYGKDGSRLAHTAESLAGKTFEGSSKALRESFEAGGLKYTFQGKADLSVKVVGYSEEPAGALVVPSSVEYGGDEFPVATVAVDAFRDCTGITSVDLGANAALHSFYKCSGLESLTVRDGVTSIGLSAFAYCDSLRHVEFPSTLEKVGVNAFYKYSFYGMDGTKLARTAENFAGKIFEGSSKSLRESFVADGLKYTFQAGDSPSVKLMGYTEEPEGELVVPASVEYGGAEYPVASVAQDAFRGCGGITSVVLGTNAGLHSFYRCSGLESLTISEGVTWIGVSAFAYCDGLTSVEFPSTMAKISSNAFYRCSGLESLVLNGGALEIGVSAFAYCDGIGHIEFAPTLAKIGTNAFYKFAFYDADGAKLAKSPANLAGKTFEGESKALYQVS